MWLLIYAGIKVKPSEVTLVLLQNHSTNEKRTEMLFAKLNTSLRPSVFFRALYGTRQTVVAETIRNNWR